MGAIAYTVTATFPDESLAAEYIAWLKDGHIEEVIAHGAYSGVIVRVEEPAAPARVETRYLFASRAAFDRYIHDHAPRLRSEGLKRFGERGVSFERRWGVIV